MNAQVDALVSGRPFGRDEAQRQAALLELLRAAVQSAAERLPAYGRYVATWPIPPAEAKTVADLPYLPVRLFKSDPPLSLVPAEEIKRVMSSSATTGQVPSRIPLDGVTSRRMSKGVSSIVADFIGTERRPYLVVDLASTGGTASLELGARAAAIRGLQPFARETVYCLRETPSGMELDLEALEGFAERNRDRDVLVYGFTYMLWLHLAKPLLELGKRVSLPRAHVMHSGGWKRLVDAKVGKDTFNSTLAERLGCGVERIIDFYGMVENLGVVYPDCTAGRKHAPAFGEVVIRDPLTLRPVEPGGAGLLQVCSVLPNSFPGHLLLTEDMARLERADGCACGRSGPAFTFLGRVPKAEVRGCGNVNARRGEGESR
jgi:hypothetical protein